MTDRIEDLASNPKAVWVEKLPLPVAVRWTTQAGVCQTLEGEVHYEAGDPLLTGVEGESWTMPKAVFDASHEAIPPLVSGMDGSYRKLPIPCLALQLEAPLALKIDGCGNILKGKPGDWLLQYAPDRFGIVAQGIFAKTYRKVREIGANAVTMSAR